MTLAPMAYFTIFLCMLFGLCILFRMPVAISMGFTSIALLILAGVAPEVVAQATYSQLDNFTLAAFIFFGISGAYMEYSGITKHIINWVDAFIGRIRGSVGWTAVLASALFGTLTGSALTTLGAIGRPLLPEMINRGYKKSYAAAIIAASSFLGIMIPPSAPGIIYAMTAGANVMAVWVSTIIPGILLCIGYCVVIWLNRRKVEEKVTEPFHAGEYFKNIAFSTKNAFFALLMPVIIFGGIYGGFVTPSEAGAIALLYGYIYYKFRQRLVAKEGIPSIPFKKICTDGIFLTAGIMLIMIFAASVGRAIAFCNISTAVTEFVLSIVHTKTQFLIAVNILFLIMGCLLELNTCIMIIAPLLLPVAKHFGVDITHFGAIMLVNLSVGLITPPFGLSLFIAGDYIQEKFMEIVKASWPFLIVCLIVIAMTTFMPDMILFLPRLLA